MQTRSSPLPDASPAPDAHAPAGFHAVAWLVWALAATATVQLAPSPVYVALVIAVSVLVVEAHGRDNALRAAFPVLLALGAAFGGVRVVLTALTTHEVGRVAFTVPHGTLPRIFGGFTVGGTIEWPVVLQAAADAFVVVGVMAAFGAFNAVAAHDELVRSAPRAFHEPGLVVAVGLAFVPSTIAAIRSVREADRARTGGRVVRRGRLVRLVVPVLEGGMERAMALAESMDARGFARLGATSADRVAAWLGVASLLSLGGAFVSLVATNRGLALLLGIVGALALAGAVATASKAQQSTRYRPRRFAPADWWLVVSACLSVVLLSTVALTGPSLRWSAQPLHFPSVSLAAALSIALLAAPAVKSGTRR
jgi:energy-coupling factor transport system permease protein